LTAIIIWIFCILKFVIKLLIKFPPKLFLAHLSPTVDRDRRPWTQIVNKCTYSPQSGRRRTVIYDELTAVSVCRLLCLIKIRCCQMHSNGTKEGTKPEMGRQRAPLMPALKKTLVLHANTWIEIFTNWLRAQVTDSTACLSDGSLGAYTTSYIKQGCP